MDRFISYGNPEAPRRVSKREAEEALEHIEACTRCQEREEQDERASAFGWEDTPEQRASVSRDRVERLLEYLPAPARQRILEQYDRMSDKARYEFVRTTLDELPVLDGALDDGQIVDLVAIADAVAEADAINRRGTLSLSLGTRALSDPT